jgi:hypothetical protein
LVGNKIGFMLIALLVFGGLFHVYNKRGQKKEIERIRIVRSKEAGTYTDEKSGAGNGAGHGVVGT